MSERFKEPKFTAKEIEFLKTIWNEDITAREGATQAKGKAGKKPGAKKDK